MSKQGLKKWLSLWLLAVAAFATVVLGHDDHKKNVAANAAANSAVEQSNTVGEAVPVPSSGMPATETSPAHVAEFPTLHPLIVHFPIMLIILAAAFQIVSLVVLRNEMGWAAIVLAALGVIGAYLSSNVFHPHTQGLAENAQRLLEEHELYAQYTIWLAGAGVVLKLVSAFVLKTKWWSEAVVTIVLVGAAIAVAVAGHHGAELVHKEGVGPRGNFLEMQDH